MKSGEPAFDTMNQYGSKGTPFLFVIDFECEKLIVLPLDKAAAAGVFYNFHGIGNFSAELPVNLPPLEFRKYPIDFPTYLKSFELVKEALNFGNSYLLNLTFATPVEINRSLSDIFLLSQAPYKLLFREDFTVFSPESFVRIDQSGIISSYPMKGTIDASLPGAARSLLSDPKELAEHNTIVDLIRNDLSMVATAVRVKRFRYLEEIQTNQKQLLQASSEITGRLGADWPGRLGNIIRKLLPAGSISGAPKKKTLEIIREAETGSRGFYTGIFGIFDGQNLDSAVIIRYIEQQKERYYFRSGGGITVNSSAISEYQELIDKVYVPII